MSPRAAWGGVALLVAAGMGCDPGPFLFECDPTSNTWQINVNHTPMVVVDNTPQIHVGESLSMGVFSFDRFLCPEGDPVRSVTWQVSDPAVVVLTPNHSRGATILGIAPGETSIIAQITFSNGTTTRTSDLWAAVSALRNVVRVVP